MLTAIRNSDKKKVIGSEIIKDKDASYHCEHCKKKVIHHKSDNQVRIGHFKHEKEGSTCPNQSKETEWHFKSKLDIYKYVKSNWGSKLKEVEVEKWICNNSIRPDIYIETSKNKIAIEVQATILTSSEISRRTIKYFKNGIAVLWILPYEDERVWEHKFMGVGYSDNGNNWAIIEREKVRFKEMEIWLYWAYYKKLLYWDLGHSHSSAFTLIQYTEFKNNDVEFRRDGEEHSYYGKTAKTIKSVERIIHDVEFDELTVISSKEFKPPYRNYIIPKRKIFTCTRFNE